MKFKFKLRYAVIAAVNTAAVIGACVLTAVGKHMAHAQDYNYAADRWSNGGKGQYQQISCFFSDDANFSEDSVKMMRKEISTKTASINSEENVKASFTDAYSSPPQTVNIYNGFNQKCETELTAVGGDFFLFHNFELISGSYLSESDIMQDGVVIDEELAWNAYGSNDIIGMDIYINDVKYYVAGVVSYPKTKIEKKCLGKNTTAYVTYKGAEMITGGTPSYGYANNAYTQNLSKIISYECVIPNPVKNFAWNIVK